MKNILTYFNLSTAPFNNTLDQSFYFDTPTHNESFRSLEHAVDSSKGIVLMYGPPGTGKSFLTERLIASNEIKGNIIFECDPLLENVNTLLYQLAVKLKLDPKVAKQTGLSAAMKKKLIALSIVKKKFIIIVDEAQEAGEMLFAAMRKLSTLEHNGVKLFQIVLIAQPTVLDMLQETRFDSLRQRIAFKQELFPLTKRQTVQYILHRINMVKGNSNIFQSSSMNVIYEATQGVPRLINQACENCLVAAYHQNSNIIDAKLASRAIESSLIISLNNVDERRAIQNDPQTLHVSRSEANEPTHSSGDVNTTFDSNITTSNKSQPPYLGLTKTSPDSSERHEKNSANISSPQTTPLQTNRFQAWLIKNLHFIVIIIFLIIAAQATYFIMAKERSLSAKPTQEVTQKAATATATDAQSRITLMKKPQSDAMQAPVEPGNQKVNVPYESFDFNIPENQHP